ncbi:MAG: hypothetical protein AAF487_02415 [Bacteroidota bacterium]
MGFLASIIAILGGLVAASSFITSKRPDSQGFIAKVAEYKGAIGLLLFIWGVFVFWQVLVHGTAVSGGFTVLLLMLAEIVVGFLLAYDLYQRYIGSRSSKAREMGDELKRGLEKFQTPAGIVLLILGVLSLLRWL